MKYQFQKPVVIGSGMMGATIAALLANIGIPVKLLDIVPNNRVSTSQFLHSRLCCPGLDR
jgi:3-hydroxyacyl-CoA dehydrogenase